MSFNAIMQLLDQGISSDAIVATLQKESPKIARKVKQLLLGGYGTSEILKYLSKDKKYSNDLKMPKKPEDLSEIYQYQKDYGLGASIDRMIAALGW